MADIPPQSPEPILSPLHRLLIGFVVGVGLFSFASVIMLLAWRL